MRWNLKWFLQRSLSKFNRNFFILSRIPVMRFPPLTSSSSNFVTSLSSVQRKSMAEHSCDATSYVQFQYLQSAWKSWINRDQIDRLLKAPPSVWSSAIAVNFVFASMLLTIYNSLTSFQLFTKCMYSTLIRLHCSESFLNLFFCSNLILCYKHCFLITNTIYYVMK